MKKDIDAVKVIPDSYRWMTVSRGQFARFTEMFHKKLYGSGEPTIPSDIQTCLDMIDTKGDTSACKYQDGTFDGNQRKDIVDIQYKEAVVNITNACLVHGGNDTQTMYNPYANATNAAALKIAARMGVLLPDGFNHFDASPENRYVPYQEVLQRKGMLRNTRLNNVYEELFLDDLVKLYVRIYIQSTGQMLDESLIDTLPFSADASTIKVNRASLAIITELFRSRIVAEKE